MTGKVALYLRVSTETQVESGHSLAAQEAVLTEDALKRGKLVFKVYRDAGVSGVREDRVGLRELIADAKRGCFAEVLVWSISRLSRKLSHLLKTIEELAQLGIEVRSVSEWFDSKTPVGQFCISMMGAVGQMQRDSWTESLLLGMEKRARSGLSNGLRTLGYASVPDASDPRGGKKLEVIPEEAETVRQAFDLYCQGFGLKAIVNRLSSEDRRGKNGGSLHISGVGRMLKNPAYIGKIRFRDQLFDGTHEPIISQSVWDQVQQRLQQKPQKPVKIVDREYLLSGILRCPQCGGGMVPTHTKSKRKDGSVRLNHYYACNAYINKGSNACRANSVPAGEVESVVLKWLSEALSGPFWSRKVIDTIEKRRAAKAPPLLADRKTLQGKLEAVQERQRNLLLAYECGDVDRTAFGQEAVALQTAKEEMLHTLDAAMQEAPADTAMSPGLIRQTFRDLHKVLKLASGRQQKELVHSLVAKVTLDEQRHVSGMELLFPWSPTENGLDATIPMNIAEGASNI